MKYDKEFRELRNAVLKDGGAVLAVATVNEGGHDRVLFVGDTNDLVQFVRTVVKAVLKDSEAYDRLMTTEQLYQFMVLQKGLAEKEFEERESKREITSE